MNNKTKTILGIFIFAIFISISALAYNYLAKNNIPPENISITEKENFDNAVEETVVAPDFTAIDQDGKEVKLSELIGKPVVLNFWASWCGPCQSEMSDFNKLYEEMGEDITFVMVNMTDGQRETLDKASKYIADNEFTFPVYYDTKQEAAYTYAVSSLPTSYFIDKNGNIVAAARSAIDEKTLRKGIDMINNIDNIETKIQ